MQTEIMYDIPTPIIALFLFIGMLGALYVGTVLDRSRGTADEQTRAQSSAVQGALLGLLALLLGFTFSLALSRHDDRSGHVVAEANAIGTAWLRTDLLPDDSRLAAQSLLRQYTAARVEAATIPASDHTRRAALVTQAATTFDALWDVTTAAARAEKTPVVTSVVTSLNDMIDALSARDAAVNRHVPEMVLFLMFGTFVVLGVIMGFTAAQSKTRPGVPVYSMLILIVVLVFIIIDLDRPRRGLIAVDQTPLLTAFDAMQPAS